MKIFITLLILIILSSNVYCQVTGKAFLKDQTDNSGIMVKFIPNSATAKLDSTFSNVDGSYSIILSGGLYQVIFSKIGYIDYQYNQGKIFAIKEKDSLNDVTLETGTGVFLSGKVSGKWYKSFVYIIDGDIELSNNDALIIEPGTIIKFNGNFIFHVNGKLSAIGNPSDPIIFTSSNVQPRNGDWNSIDIENSGTEIDNCVLEYCKTCIDCSNSNPTIINNDIRFFTGNGILCKNGSPIIKNNQIHDYSDTLHYIISNGILFFYDTKTIIECNTIYNGNGNGIYLSSNVQVINNVIHDIHYTDVTGNGLLIDGSNSIIKNNHIFNCVNGIENNFTTEPMIVNNTIYNNSNAGIIAGSPASPSIVNNIIFRNVKGIEKKFNESGPTNISYNLVWNNSEADYKNIEIVGIGTNVTKNQNGDEIDSYYNLSQDPLFVDNTPPKLRKDSPCLNAGNPLYSPNIGFDGSNICGNEPTAVFNPLNKDELPIIIHPNPFNSFTNISLPDNIYNATLSFFDVLGNKVKEISNIKTNNLILKRDNLQTGIYFYLLMDSGKIIGNGKIMVY